MPDPEEYQNVYGDGYPLEDGPDAADTSPVVDEFDQPTEEDDPGTPDHDDTGTPEGTATDTGQWRQRYADVQRWAQQNEQRARAAEERIRRLEAAGIDLQQLEQMAAEAAPQPAAHAGATPQNQGITPQIQQAYAAIQWDMARLRFDGSNPDYRSGSDLGGLVDGEATRIMREELQQYGTITKSPEEVLNTAKKRVTALVQKLRGEGKKSAMNKKRQVAGQAVTPGQNKGQQKPQEPEDEKEFNARDAWTKSHVSAQDRFRSRG